METGADPRFEVHRVSWRVVLTRLNICCLSLVAVLDVVDATRLFAPVFLAFFVVMVLREVCESRRPIASVDDAGINYADGWTTRRVAFGDVTEWERDREKRSLTLTTHDGNRWWVYLAAASLPDRTRLLAHLTARLPRGSIRDRHEVIGAERGWLLLAELAGLAVLTLAITQILGSFPRQPAAPEPLSRLSVSAPIREPARSGSVPTENLARYGPLAGTYRVPFRPEVAPLPLYPYFDGPWEAGECHATPALMVAISGCAAPRPPRQDG